MLYTHAYSASLDSGFRFRHELFPTDATGVDIPRNYRRNNDTISKRACVYYIYFLCPGRVLTKPAAENLFHTIIGTRFVLAQSLPAAVGVAFKAAPGGPPLTCRWCVDFCALRLFPMSHGNFIVDEIFYTEVPNVLYRMLPWYISHI